ncbi:MAG: class I SAM-dependent methyltransferase [Candidatus Lokiarchaeota archaeon]|nr:class I SAM-dependent methyltransferase [Candidatus Lokiarchaeota archaeon]
MDQYFRGIVINELKENNFFEFLQESQEFLEIKQKFEASDEQYLRTILTALLSDNTIQQVDSKYKLTSSNLNIRDTPPLIFDEPIQDLAINMAKAVFDRIHGKYFQSTSGFNLFLFDDVLSQKAYEILRRAALSFAPEPKHNPGKLLDLGCGNGTGTADIWVQIMEQHKYNPNKEFEIIGIDINEDLLSLAQEEFYRLVKKFSNIEKEDYLKLKYYYPKFQKGTSTSIPFPDNYFDFVYISQVMHWTDLKQTLNEVFRVLKPNGIFFGTQVLIPRANSYLNLMLKTIDGADGFFTKQDFIKYAKEAGFSILKFCTPATIFKFLKKLDNTL